MTAIKLSPFILLLFYSCASCNNVYTNTWAVKILCHEPCVMPEGLALKHGLENLSQVSGKLPLHYAGKKVVESRS